PAAGAGKDVRRAPAGPKGEVQRAAGASPEDKVQRAAGASPEDKVQRAAGASSDDKVQRAAGASPEDKVQRAAGASPEDKVQRAAKADEKVQRAASPASKDTLQRAPAEPGVEGPGHAGGVKHPTADAGTDDRRAQRAAEGAAPTVTQDVDRRLDQAEGRGAALDPGVRHGMEGRLATDLSGVRVHTDGEAGSLAKRLDARAFTTGQDVFFGEGQYDPGSRKGQQLIAHELVHTVQQKGDGGPRRAARATTVSQPGEPAEVEAETIAQRVTEGAHPAPAKAGNGGVQRAAAATPALKQGGSPTAPANDDGAFHLQFPGGAVSFPVKGETGEAEFDLGPYAERIPGLRLGMLTVKLAGNGTVKGATISAGVAVPFVSGAVSISVDEKGAIGKAGGDLVVEVPHFATGKLEWSYEAGALSGTLNVGARQIQVPGLPLKDSSLTIRVVSGVLSVDGHATTGDGVPGLSEGRLTVAYDGQRKAFAIAVGATVDVPGLDAATFDVAMDADGRWTGSGDVSTSFTGGSGSVHLEMENWAITAGEGTVAYTRGPLAGSLTVRLTPPEEGKPGELAIGGEGDLAVEVAPWLKGSGHAVLYPDGNVDLSGALTFPSEVELFKEKRFEKTLFQMDQEFPLWGVTIPVVGSIGLIAEIHAKLGVRTTFGPAVLRDILVEGTYSTREGKAPEAGGSAASGAGDPDAAPEPSFAVSGEFFVPAGAELVVIVGGGVGLSALIAKLSGGIDMVGTAGAYSTLSVRPRFQYQDGKYSFKGVAELQAALVASLGINAYAAAEVGIGWLSKEVWRKDWELANFTWDPGMSLGMKAGLDYTLGESFEPKFDVEPITVDPKKLVKAAMPDSGKATPDKPKNEKPKINLKLDPAPESVTVDAQSTSKAGVPQKQDIKGGGGKDTGGGTTEGRGEMAVEGEADSEAPPFVPPKPAAAEKVPEDETHDEGWEVYIWDHFLSDLESSTGRHIARKKSGNTKKAKNQGEKSKSAEQRAKQKQSTAENLDPEKAWEKFRAQKGTRKDFDAKINDEYWDYHHHEWKPRRYRLREDYKEMEWPLWVPPQKAGIAIPGMNQKKKKVTHADILKKYKEAAQSDSKPLRAFPREPRGNVRTTWKNADLPVANPAARGKDVPHAVDHIIELQVGGSNELENLQLLEESDNSSAGSSIMHQVEHDRAEANNAKVQYKKVVGTEADRLNKMKKYGGKP
ncbi:MAG TPA: DUF4157 domain-containing protein, partial [Longimicrobiaceae bacterium]|nr:DUF4157 domain-containing protein [Longimicrobiaceae bacterium]